MDGCLLLVIRDEQILGRAREALVDHYELLTAADWDNGLAIMRQNRKRLTAVLVELALMDGRDDALPSAFSGDDPFSQLPVIGVLPGRPRQEQMELLERGIYDIISTDTPKQLILRRIRSAVRAMDSISFLEIEKLLKALPSNIFLKDTDGRYVFCTHYWHHLHNADEPGWTIRGKTDLEIRKDKENARRAMEADCEILRTGKGTEYVIEEHADGVSEFLELIKRPVFDENGKITGIIALINDVTEQELLKLELEKRAQVDQLTELLNKSTTGDLIDIRVRGGRKSGKSGALMMIDVDNFKTINDGFGHAAGDHVLAEIGRVIRNSFRGSDVAGRVGGDEFMIYVQDVASGEAAVQLAERISEQVRQTLESYQVTLSVGISLFPAHGESFEELYRAADAALYTVKKNGKAACCLFEE